jgi:hypothetical protein
MSALRWLASGFLVWARVTANAFLLAAAGVTASALVRAAARLDATSILAFGGLIALALFLASVTLLVRAARDTAADALLADGPASSRARFERLLTPVSFGMAAVIAVWLGVGATASSGPLRWLELVLFLIVGYVIAPTLIRSRIFPRLLERLGGRSPMSASERHHP